jgi:phosphoglycolate phosphatase
MAHDIVLFDLDGTLSDPLEGIAKSINFALSHFGFPLLDLDEVRKYVGPQIDHIFSEITCQTSPTLLGALVQHYRERYADVGYSENVLYSGVPEALARLRGLGVVMAVCMSKRRDFAERILDMFSLRDYFEFVDGGEVGLEKWQQIETLRSRRQVSAASLMVGDRAVDLIAARRNGLSAGAVLWGYGSEAELAPESPAYVFRSPAEWLQIVSIANAKDHPRPEAVG